MTATLTPAPAPPALVEPAVERPVRVRQDRRFVWLLIAAVVVGGGLRIAIGLTDDAPSSDETAYLSSGGSLVEGDGFEREGRPELHFPPFVPFVLGLASRLFSDAHTGTVWVTVVAGTAAVVPLALLARRIAGDLAGAATAWIAALAPGLATMPATRGSGTETEYVLLVATALWLVVSAVDLGTRARLVRVAGAGLLIGLAYLTRPEGLFLAVPIGAAALLSTLAAPNPRHGAALANLAAPAANGAGSSSNLAAGWRLDGRLPALFGALRQRWRRALAVGLAFGVPLLVCVVPYAAYLHEHTGRWELTAKTQDVSLEAWHAVARGDRHARDQILYALDETGYRFTDERSPLTTLAREDPGGYLGIVRTNVATLLKDLGGVSLLPLPLWALAGYGAWRLRRSRTVALVLAVTALPVLTALAFFVQPRYLVLVSALGTVLAGVGAARLPARFRPAALGLVVALLVVTSVQSFHGDAGWGHPADHTDQRLAGEWIADHTDPDDTVMTRSMIVWYYAERPTLAIPYADLDRIVRFGRHYGARYLVVDSPHAERVRPQLVPLLSNDDMAGLRLVHEVRAEGRTSRIFAFDPPPPPTHEVGPSLGFMGDGQS